MNEDININEVKQFWSYNGESSEIDDIASLREMACTDINYLLTIIKRQQEELTQ
jgi:hypothetical protein